MFGSQRQNHKLHQFTLSAGFQDLSPTEHHRWNEQLDPEAWFYRKMGILCLQYVKDPDCFTSDRCWVCVSQPQMFCNGVGIEILYNRMS